MDKLLYPQVYPTNDFIEFRRDEIEQSIPERFEAQVAKYPHRPALKTKDHQFSYQMLNEAANKIAHALLARRGEAAEPAALLLEQGAAPVTAIMGVIKAGKFYVPLDPSYPQARIRYILADSSARVLITNTRQMSLAQELAAGKIDIINIDQIEADLSTANPDLALSPDCLAYIMYTSGSTGQPKGVIENHRNLLHHMMRITNGFHICKEDRQVLLRSYSFNGSVRDIFGTLLNGACLHPLNLEKEGLDKLAGWLAAEKITTYRSVISIYRNFVSHLTGKEQFPHLRLIHVGGEPVTKRDVELFQTHFSENCILVNGLGITEAGTLRHFFVGKETRLEESFVPVGYPVEDVEIMLLNDAGQEVEPGQVGEIVIRSPFFSPGYWQKPDLTHAKFLPDPRDTNKRLYLTGDLGRMLPDGCLIHLGRKDFQVKVRGHRIEIAEVEAAMLALASVKEVLVLAQANSAGEQALVAYLVPAEHPAPTITSLRNSLAQVLPDYMIPSTFVLLEAMPLTPNGKVDRQALPAPGSSRPVLANSFVAPGTGLEQKLARIWEEVLDIHPIGIRDSFFDLGGHSLSAVRLLAEIETQTGKKLHLATLFQSPTIEQQARLLQDNQAKTSLLVPIQPNGTKLPFFCVPGGGDNAFIFTDLARHLGPEQPFYAFRFPQRDNEQSNAERIKDMAARYIKEIKTVQTQGPYLLGGYCFGGEVAFEMAHQLETQGDSVGLVAIFESYLPGAIHLPGMMPRLQHHWRQFLQLPQKEKLAYVAMRGKARMLKLSRKLSPELGRSVHEALGEGKYVPQHYSGRLTLFRAKEHPPELHYDPYMGWSGLAAGGIELHEIPGTHINAYKEPNVSLWAAQIMDCLEQAQCFSTGKLI